ncbi:integral membrane protein DUF92-domain-containing protein [Polychytrium aggregatum]|uniref:integral membrane protein DUF92-domain-containing protein n=1 Tax=Polychytrium aggregatum TaxID=110093 RepID=UPI0022FEADBE|nr:integral membrane protein DUF92-domain-containing protein [Polychytrium aggregatum]KAI9202563.1 integral membrane protein DUF92-domain-containing protein [Polychytrium aggregatum]
MHIVLAIAGSGYLAYSGLKKKSLSPSGAAAACALGLAVFTHPYHLFAVVLVVFYLSGSRLTKYKAERKRQLEESYLDGGQRTAYQVFCNGFLAGVVCVLHRLLVLQTAQQQSSPDRDLAQEPLCFAFGSETDSATRLNAVLIISYVALIAACCGDTFSSELGILSKSPPYLITTFKQVPPGTNGGVSPLGLLGSLLGGLMVGVFGGLLVPLGPGCPRVLPTLQLVVTGAAAGVVGSLIDSLMGATLQKSVYNKSTKKIAGDHRVVQKGESASDFEHVSGLEILDNHMVNLLSSLATGLVFAALASL